MLKTTVRSITRKAPYYYPQSKCPLFCTDKPDSSFFFFHKLKFPDTFKRFIQRILSFRYRRLFPLRTDAASQQRTNFCQFNVYFIKRALSVNIWQIPPTISRQVSYHTWYILVPMYPDYQLHLSFRILHRDGWCLLAPYQASIPKL